MSGPRRIILQIDDSHKQSAWMERAVGVVDMQASVTSIHDPTTAIAHLELCGTSRPLPSLVLVDRSMPEVDGFTVLRRLRDLPKLATVSVCMVTGSDDIEHRLAARDLGADFVTKPAEEDRQKYVEFARRVVLPPVQKIGGIAYQSTAVVDSPLVFPPLTLAAMTLPHPAAIAAASPLINKEPFHVLMALNEANIDMALLTDPDCKEDVVNNKRKVFARVMMAFGYANAQIRRYVKFGDAWYEKRRAEWRKSEGLRLTGSN